MGDQNEANNNSIVFEILEEEGSLFSNDQAININYENIDQRIKDIVNDLKNINEETYDYVMNTIQMKNLDQMTEGEKMDLAVIVQYLSTVSKNPNYEKYFQFPENNIKILINELIGADKEPKTEEQRFECPLIRYSENTYDFVPGQKVYLGNREYTEKEEVFDLPNRDSGTVFSIRGFIYSLNTVTQTMSPDSLKERIKMGTKGEIMKVARVPGKSKLTKIWIHVDEREGFIYPDKSKTASLATDSSIE